jgi:threonine dehydrogenase-like Zn-dependent dehydrogenase
VKAVVYEGPRDVKVKDIPDAKIEQPTDVLVRIISTHPGATYGFAGMGPYRGGQAELLRVPYQHFDARDNGLTRVVLKPAMAG